MDSPNFPNDTRIKSYAGSKMVYSRAERVFILGHYFASKSFVAVREAFSNAYPGKEVPNKTTIHRLVTEFWYTGSVYDKCSLNDKTAKITAGPISGSASAATTGYGCKNSILPVVSSFCVRRVHVYTLSQLR
jgi:hypothetical protein